MVNIVGSNPTTPTFHYLECYIKMNKIPEDEGVDYKEFLIDNFAIMAATLECLLEVIRDREPSDGARIASDTLLNVFLSKLDLNLLELLDKKITSSIFDRSINKSPVYGEDHED